MNLPPPPRADKAGKTGTTYATLCAEYCLVLEGRNYGDHIPVDEKDLERCRRDPDQFAADYLGVTVAQFRCWIEEGGYPKCAGTDKRGQPCRVTIGWCCSRFDRRPYGLEAEVQWFLGYHRSNYCRRHGGGAP
jgi:hypothetical protein